MFDVTRTGLEALEADPLRVLVQSLDALPENKRTALCDALVTLNKSTEESEEGDEVIHFGTCSSCRYFRQNGQDAGYCSQSSAALELYETDKLCCRFSSI